MHPIDLVPGARTLSKDSLLRIRRSRGKTVLVLEGRVWITQDSDPRDIFLDDGESLTLDTREMTLVQALADTRLLVLAPLPDGQVVTPVS
ncbi:MAG TPA: DUF2917 domain-containing protein [Zeimonas sp.]|nr:DUF2917 domain-containing protein [Zeimonas sp.]